MAAARQEGFDQRGFRQALGSFPTGVCVVTCSLDGELFGMTMSSFNSLSLDPPLVVWSLNRRSASLAAFEQADRYTINVLAHDQAEIARRFSRPHSDRFEGVDFKLGKAGTPLIAGCVAWFECRHYARHRAGDHVLFVGEVATCRRRKDAGLVFHHGRFGTTHAPPRRA